MKMNTKLLLTLLLVLLLTMPAQAAPDSFTVARQTGSRTPYLWWNASGKHARGEIRYPACVGSTMHVEALVYRNGQFERHTFLLARDDFEIEHDYLPRLDHATGTTCTLRITNGIYFKKSLVAREIYLPIMP